MRRSGGDYEAGNRCFPGYACAGCAAWIFSGATAHMATFVMMLAIAQLEYFRTVMLTGVYPARRIALASMTGTVIEFYDFFIYGTAAALVRSTRVPLAKW